MTTLTALALLTLAAGDAQACINDMERYQRQRVEETPAEPPTLAEVTEEVHGDGTYVRASAVGGAAALSLLLGLGLPLHQRRKQRAWEALD